EYGDKFQNLVDLFTDSLGKGLYKAASNFAEIIGGYQGQSSAERLSSNLGKNIPKLVDLGYLSDLSERITALIAKLSIESKNSPNRVEFISKALASIISDKFPEQSKQAINLAFSLGTLPIKIKNQIEIANQAALIKELVGNGKNLKAIATLSQYFDLAGKDIKQLNKVLFTVAGFQRSSGYKGDQIASMVKPFVEEGVTVVPIRNRDTDRSFNENPKSAIASLFTDIAENLGIKDTGKISTLNNTLYNLEISLTKAFRGYDRDAVRMATIGHILKTLNPKMELGSLGFSGGGQIVKQFVAIMEAIGHENVLGVGAGTPTVGVASAKTKGYRGVISFTDEQAAYYDKTQLVAKDMRAKFVSLAKNLEVSDKFLRLVPFNIPKEISVAKAPTNHNLSQYLYVPETYNLIQKQLANFLKPSEAKNDIKV
ncbi:MAG: hypothetical protein ACRDBG_12360, partial [Waterburya sp.]